MSVRNDHHERTIVAPAIIAGVGVHTGRRVRLAVRPAPSGTGIVFVRTDPGDDSRGDDGAFVMVVSDRQS